MDELAAFVEKFTSAGGEIASSLSHLASLLKGVERFAAEKELRGLIASSFDFLTEVEPKEAQVSFTKAVCGVVETGSLVFAYSTEGEHLLTALPRIHVAFLSRKRICPTVEQALSGLMDRAYVSVITGPSKTGDIELIHVMGVHGPERLILCWED